MEVIEIAPTEDESCCSCHTDNVRLYKWTDELRSQKTHQHCDLCYETEFGRRCGDKFSGYGDAMDIMRHMVQLEHIRNKRGGPADDRQR